MKSERDEDEDDGYFQDEEVFEEVRERQQFEVGDPTPIYQKKKQEQPEITIKLLQIQKPDFVSNFIPFKLNKNEEIATISKEQKNVNYKHLLKFESPFTKYYDADQLVYQKYHNEALNKFKDTRYYAGFFIPKSLLYDSIRENTSSFHQICQEYVEKPIKKVKTPRKLKSLLPQHTEQQLIFDSNFQSGNLFAVFKTNKYSYDLVMQNDTNSKGSNQWFYFSVEKMLPNVEYTFTIINFTKRDSLFNYGLRPAYFSTIANKRNGTDWFRYGDNVSYYRGEMTRENSLRHYYALTFSITNKYSDDKIFLAHSFPYTYTKLNSFLNEMIKIHNTGPNSIITKFSIGTTLSGRFIFGLKILEGNKKKQNRKAIIILARQHPGETQGSYVCEGVIKKLLQRGSSKKQKQADFIRKNYIIYVIPMINIDGVVFGHYRTNLAGKDLNRKWGVYEKEWFCQQISQIKSFLTEVAKENPIRFILDLHGHSKKMGSFFYGNPCQDNPQIVRIFPYICSRLNPAIQFMDCTFQINESKKKAARVYLSLHYHQLHVYTFQSSFYGYTKNSKTVEFTPQQYINLGETLVQSLYIQLLNDNLGKEGESKLEELNKQMNSKDGRSSKLAKKQQNLPANVLFMKFFNELKNDDILLGIGNEDESGSESEPDEGQINIAQITVEKRKRKLDLIKETKQIKESKQTKIMKPKEETKTLEKLEKPSVIRFINRKQHSTVEYKQLLRPVRNMKFLALSQVNAVLPDKYHISLQPLERKNNRLKSLTVTAETQTEVNQKLPDKIFKMSEISEKSNLIGQSETFAQRTSHLKKNSQMAIQNNQSFRSDFTSDEPLIRKRQRSQHRNMRTLYTQTILSYKNSQYSPNFKSSEKKSLKITTENEARIARMEQINLQVLKVYSRRSAVADISFKQRDRQKSSNRVSYLSSAKRKDSHPI